MRLILGFVGSILFLWNILPAYGAEKNKPSLFGGKPVNEWVKDLSDRDPGIRENAVQAIAMLGPTVQKEAGPALIALFRDKDTALRVHAAMAAGTIGFDQKDMALGIEGLKRLLLDSQSIVRFHAITALGRLGRDAKSAIPDLISRTKDAFSFEIRKAAVYALAATGVESELSDLRAIKAVSEALGDHCSQVRSEAVMSLIILGSPARPLDRQGVLYALQQVYSDRDKSIAVWARIAAMRVENKVAESHLAMIGKFLKNPSGAVRTQAARALASLGPQAKSQIPNLITALEDKDSGVVLYAVTALGQMGEVARGALPALQRLKEHKEEIVKNTVEDAIMNITKKKPPQATPVSK